MATKIADIYAALGLDDSVYNRKLDAAQGKASAWGGVVQGILQGVGQRLFDGIIRGAEAFVSKMDAAVNASSDLNEEVNKSGVVFGSAAASVVKWSQTTTASMGVSQVAALRATGQFGALFRQMGDLPDVAATTSQGLVQIAADLSSIYNIPIDQALLKLRSGLAGEAEPLRAVNIFLNEHAVAQKAVQLGLAASTDAVNESAKVHARYAIIVEQAAIAQGDQSRTSRELAGAQRKLDAEMEDGAARLGNVFRPAVTAITNILADTAPQMFQYGENILDQLAAGLAAGIRAILPVIQVVRQLFTYWFAPGSPPRVLPDIDKWGAAAMQQFLSGFSSVDVKGAFAGIGNAIENILRSDVSAGKADEAGLVGRVFGTRNAIMAAVAEFSRAGSVSEATINKIVRSAGGAGTGIGALVKAYFSLQTATTAATRAQDDLNRITERYDAILNPLRSQLDGVRAEQQALANQQRLIAAQNTLANFDSTDAEKRAAALEIQQISLEQQIATTEQQKAAETDKAQAQLDGATKAQTAAQKQLDAAQATIDLQVQQNNLLGEQRQLEQRLAQEREAEAEKQQRLAEQLHQAQLQYQLGIANTQGKLAILRGELANTTAGSAEYYSLLGQIASLEKQAAEDAKRDAERVSDAQFAYNLELADTNGKIALYQEKLKGVTEGSAEYFEILSKIHALQEQAAKGGGAGDALGAGFSLPDLADMPKLEELSGGASLKKVLEEAFAPIPEATENISALAQKIEILVDKIGALFGIDFSSWSTKTTEATTIASDGFALYGQKAIEANSSVDISTDSTVEKISGAVDVLTALVNGDWATLWQMYKTHALEAYSETDKDTQAKLDRMEVAIAVFSEITNFTWARYFEVLGSLWDTGTTKISTTVGGWLSSLTEKFTGWFTTQTSAIGTSLTGFGTAFYNGGAKMVTQFLDGLKSAWGSVETWFTGKLAGLRAQLPFSEPKDPASPLRGLAKSGESMVNMIQGGMDKASLNINPLANNLLAAPTGATTNTSNITIPITVNISGNATEADVRRGVASGADDIITAIRAAGVSY